MYHDEILAWYAQRAMKTLRRKSRWCTKSIDGHDPHQEIVLSVFPSFTIFNHPSSSQCCFVLNRYLGIVMIPYGFGCVCVLRVEFFN